MIHEIGDASICLCTRLKIAYLIASCELLSLLLAYLSLCNEVHLVSNQHDWQAFVFILEYALYPIVYVSESFCLGEVKDDDHPVRVSEKAISQLTESVLSGGVPNFHSAILIGITFIFDHGEIDAA